MLNRINRKPRYGVASGLAFCGLCALALSSTPAFASPDNDYRQAYESYASNDMAKAIEHLSSALKSGGTSRQEQASILYNRSLTYDLSGETDLAIRDLDQVLSLQADNAPALNNRGALKTSKGDYDQAVKDFDQAIRIEPRFAKAYYNRGIAKFRQGQFDRAVEDYTQALQIQSDYAWAYCNRGAAHRALCRFDLAIADYDRAIQLKPDYALAHYGRGSAHYASGQYDLAIKDFDRAIQLEPAAPYGYNRLAWLYATSHSARHQNGEKALTYAQKAVELRREAATLDTLAAAQARMGQTKEASVTQKEALTLLSTQAVRPPEMIRQYRQRLAIYTAGGTYEE